MTTQSRMSSGAVLAVFLLICVEVTTMFAQIPPETPAQRDARMRWWREARFGLFIHWGLYAIPAGEWQGNTEHGEWIMHTAQIPVEQYEQFRLQFNPVKFDADQWVRLAKEAGMRYIVITSKHHDGFCLFDSKHTDYDIMSTPFQRDIMRELSQACARHGLKICWYHSIMDWHHPDYLPRRPWEKRPAAGADFARFRQYLHNQVTELLTNYGPIGVMWFDGEWEDTWRHEYGVELYNLCRTLQPDVIVNNRVDVGREGMAGLTREGEFVGDFGTPEQEVPATGLPGVDWETCMTMNRHWGYNKHDHDWKSATELIRTLADVASKGGNFLLNVGPTAEGEFPAPCVERLKAIGAWMKVNSEAIYATQASPFPVLPWGRCTQKALSRTRTRLYLHVFEWPEDGRLTVPGILNRPHKAFLLASPRKLLKVARKEDALVIHVPAKAPDSTNSVVVLDIDGPPQVVRPPIIEAENDIFIDSLSVRIAAPAQGVGVRYTTDGTDPTASSPLAGEALWLTQTATVKARCFRGKKPLSAVSQADFLKVPPLPPARVAGLASGLHYDFYHGVWDALPDFDSLTPVKSGTVSGFDFAPRDTTEHFAFRYTGFLRVPRDGVYRFFTVSDDGSSLSIAGQLVVDNDGLHSALERSGAIALAAGFHPITVTFFERTGGDVLQVLWTGPGIEKQPIPAEVLFHRP
ncbi:MAG: alpha-L-fucosidase [candidate division KSB1 bacterium]|nr:alpha-L-fucosidase [candidate division KSB1 bacterium]